MKNNISNLAKVLNEDLNESVAFRVLSERGKKIYFPHKGILGQSAEAKSAEINATIGTAFENDGTPLVLSSVQKTIALPEKELQSSFLYQPSFGKLQLRRKWAEKMLSKNPSLSGNTNEGTTVKFSEPVVTAALTHALSVSASLFVNEGDTVLISDLYWDNYDLIFAESFGAKIELFNTFKNGNFDTESLKNALAEKIAVAKINQNAKKVIILLNFPNNPTGYTITEKEADEIVSILKSGAENGLDLVVLLDDAYFGLVYEKGIFTESLFGKIANLHENLLAVKLDGPTKEDFVWGFRVGFITFAFKGASDKQLKALTDKAAGTVRATISNAPSLSQEILFAAYNSESYENEKQEKFNTLRKRYEKIKEILKSHPEYSKNFEAMPFNSGYFMCVKVLGVEPEAVRQECLKNGVGVIVLSGLIRIAFSSVAIDKLEVLFARLNKAITALKG
ncbi:hypothetical protein AGMMS49938_14150 [Fibrobacterales bacterium]|nr:hypothetical protein AGMMS49938_14150 [Fibrobacterales bacterium]